MSYCRLLGVLLWGAFGSVAIAGPGNWTGQGPFGGDIHQLMADPTSPSRLYAISTYGAVQRSVDGGASWQGIATRLAKTASAEVSLAIDPQVTGRLWLSIDGDNLFRSVDGGETWTHTGFSAGPMQLARLSAGGGATPAVYAAMRTVAGGGGIHRSTDGGASFVPLPGSPASGSIHIDPHDPQHLIAGADTRCSVGEATSAMYRSTNGGASWAAVMLPGGCYQSQRLTVSYGPAGSNRMYAFTSRSGTYRSDDSGATWASIGVSGLGAAVSPASANVLWLLSNGTMKSTDGGATAVPRNSGLTTNGSLIPRVYAIALHPQYPATPRLWVSTSAGVFVSNNDGASWNQSNDGLAATNIRALALHPVDPSRAYAGIGDSMQSMVFFRTTSTGGWVASNSGLEADQLRVITPDPTTAASIGETVLYAGGKGPSFGPPLEYNSGIYKSNDAGMSWTTLSSARPGGTPYPALIRSIVLDPRSCAVPPLSGPCTSGPLRTVYAAGSGTRVVPARIWKLMKSTDAGLTWSSSENGIPDYRIDADLSSHAIGGIVPLVIDPQDPQTLYAGTFAVASDSAGDFIAPQIESGVFKTIDGGENWVHKSHGLPRFVGSDDAVVDVLSMAINPINPQTLWASTIDLNLSGAPGEIYKTTNGGGSWFRSNAGITSPDARALLVDPNNPDVIYVASAGFDSTTPGGVYKSADGGASWKSISIGLPSSSATSLALNPIDPRILHAGTMAGVYTITQLTDTDGDGVPDLIENAGPNGGDADGDGIPDSLQPNVASTALGLLSRGWQPESELDNHARDYEAHEAQLRDHLQSGIVGGYFTVKLVGGSCSEMVDVAPVDPGPFGLDRTAHYGTHAYPRGLVGFELPQCSDALVDVIFNAANFANGWSWRFYGPSTPGDPDTMGWHDAESLVVSRTATTWRLHLRGGQFGSYRPAAAGSILFVGGPAENEIVFRNGFDG